MQHCKYCFSEYTKEEVLVNRVNTQNKSNVFQCQNCFSIDHLKKLNSSGGKCFVCKEREFVLYYEKCGHCVCDNCKTTADGKYCGYKQCPVCNLEQWMVTPIFAQYVEYFNNMDARLKELFRNIYVSTIYDLPVMHICDQTRIVMCIEYHKWLVLLAGNRDKKLSPSNVIDMIWRYSALDLENYEQVCKAINGELIYYDENVDAYGESYYDTINMYIERYGCMDDDMNNTTANIWAPKYEIQLGMPIYIRTLTGKIVTVYCSPHQKFIFVLLALIQKYGGIGGKFISSGKFMKNDGVLSNYNIQKGSTLHQVMWLRGC